ncbi:hypothetical protein AB0C91_22220 [Streptomyces sp. NPDC048674]|uniref:hypothetical protein n=1 Tax=Streptomyces sp. NPDC048674 TaxID=3155491 RepID=UPI00341AADD9
MLPRRSLRIDLTPRELPFGIIGSGGAWLSLSSGTHPAVALLMAFAVSIRATVRLV